MTQSINQPPFDIAHEVGSKEFLRPLIRLGLPARIRPLACGDFAFLGNGPHGWARIGIERKTVNELVGSMSRERYIRRQLPNMLQRYHFSFLIVEGLLRPSSDGVVLTGHDVRKGQPLTAWSPAGWQDSTLYGTFLKQLFSLRLLTTVHVVGSTGTVETAHLLHALYGWFQKPWLQHKSMLGVDTDLARYGVKDALILSDRTMRRETFAKWPGISWERSARVSRYFSSVREAACATEEEWRKALGFKEGKVLARRVVQFLNGESEPEAKA